MVTIKLSRGPSTTQARVSFDGFSALGEAKRCPNDTDRQDVGDSLAIGRALQILGEDLEHYAVTRSHQH